MGRQAKGVRLIRLDDGQKLVSVVAFEEEEHDEQNGSGGGEGHIAGAVKLKTEQSVSDILKMDSSEVSDFAEATSDSPSRLATADEIQSFGAASDESDEFAAFEEHVDSALDDIVAQESAASEDKGSMLDEF